jgi:hypothetical protein
LSHEVRRRLEAFFAMSTRLVALAGLLGALVCAGCGDASKRYHEVSGAVTFKGETVPDGVIRFFAVGDKPFLAGGAMIHDGAYRLPAEHGLKPGQYLVRISSREFLKPSANAPQDVMSIPFLSRERIPARFNTESTLTVEVQAGKRGQFDFNLE